MKFRKTNLYVYEGEKELVISMYLFSRYNSKRFKKLGKTFVIIEYYSIFWTSDPEEKGEHFGPLQMLSAPWEGTNQQSLEKEGDFHVSAI